MLTPKAAAKLKARREGFNDPRAVPTLCPESNEKIRKVERVTVTRIVVGKGRGVEGSVYREATYWFDGDGNLIGFNDPFPDGTEE